MLKRVLSATFLFLIASGQTTSPSVNVPITITKPLNTPLVLVNDSSSSQPAGQPTQTFAMPFKDSVLCGGAAPVFTDGSSNVLNYSYGLQAYWPDGCLKEATFMLLPAVTTAGNRSQTITVTSAGAWPSASGRSTTDIYNQNLVVSMPAAPGLTAATWGANLIGTWVSNLAADANNYGGPNGTPSSPKPVKWLDGSAGSAWRISTEMVIACTGTISGTSVTSVSCAGTSDITPLSTGEVITGANIPTSGTTISGINTSTNAMTLSNAGTSGSGVTFNVQHGQLRFDHYIQVFNDVSGNLGGFRWLGAARQPKYNYDTPAKNYRAFHVPDFTAPAKGPNWKAGASVATPLTWLGGDGKPMVSISFSVSSGQVPGFSVFASTDNFYFGSFGGTACPGPKSCFPPTSNAIPAMFTGSSLPPEANCSGGSSFDKTQVYWIESNQNTIAAAGAPGANGVLGVWCNGPPGNGKPQSNFTAAGSGTVTPIPVIEPFTRLWFADPHARYNFFQGAGDVTAETTLRVAINQAYVVTTAVWPPWAQKDVVNGNAAVTGVAKGGKVPDILWDIPGLRTTNALWNPFNIGMLYTNQDATGDHYDLGPIPTEQVASFYNDTAADDLLIRTEGLSAGLAPQDIKDETSDTLLNILDASLSSYTGLPSSVASSVVFGYGGGCAGFTCPPNGDWSAEFGAIHTSHKPNYSTMAYLKTGELQYLDLLMENAQFAPLYEGDLVNRNAPDPANTGTTLRGVVTSLFGLPAIEPRSQAWGNRDIQFAAGLVPYNPTTPSAIGYDGTQIGKYIYTMATNNCHFAADLMNSANASNGYGTAAGANTNSVNYVYSRDGGGAPLMWLSAPNRNNGNLSTWKGAVSIYGGEETEYVLFGFDIGAATRQDSNCKSWITDWASYANYNLIRYGGFNTYGFVYMIGIPGAGEDGNLLPAGSGIATDDYMGQKIEGVPWNAPIVWQREGSPTSRSPSFSIASFNRYPGLTNGNVIMFCGPGKSSNDGIGCGGMNTVVNGPTTTTNVSNDTLAVQGIHQSFAGGWKVWDETTGGTLIGTIESGGVVQGNANGGPILILTTTETASVSVGDILLLTDPNATTTGCSTTVSSCDTLDFSSTPTAASALAGSGTFSAWDITTNEWLGNAAHINAPNVQLSASAANTVSNGDVIEFNLSPPMGFSPYTPYYVRDNTSTGGGGSTFNLCNTVSSAGGNCSSAAIPTIDAGSMEVGWWREVHAANSSPTFGSGVACAYTSFASVPVEFRGGIMWAQAILGSTTALNNLVSDLNAHMTSNSWTAWTGSFVCGQGGPLAGLAPRYSLQNNFGP